MVFSLNRSEIYGLLTFTQANRLHRFAGEVLHNTLAPDLSGSSEIPDVIGIKNTRPYVYIRLTEHSCTEYLVAFLYGEQYRVMEVFNVFIPTEMLINDTFRSQRSMFQHVPGVVCQTVSSMNRILTFRIYDFTRHCFSGAGRPPDADVI